MKVLFRRFYGSKKEFKETLKAGPTFFDFINDKKGEKLRTNSSGDARLPQWLKTPIAVGERYSHLKETLRDLKLHTVKIMKYRGL